MESSARPDRGDGVRPARLRDVVPLVRLYRVQLRVGPAKLTPFPFDRVRLSVILLAIVSLRPWMRLVRRLPGHWATWILVAESEPDGSVVGVGFLHEVEDRDGGRLGRTGLLVDPHRRRQGYGVQLKVGLVRLCRREEIPRVEAYLDPRNEASIAVNRRVGLAIREGGPGDPKRPLGRYLIAEGATADLLARWERTSGQKEDEGA